MSEDKCQYRNQLGTLEKWKKTRPMMALFLILAKCARCQKPCEILTEVEEKKED